MRTEDTAGFGLTSIARFSQQNISFFIKVVAHNIILNLKKKKKSRKLKKNAKYQYVHLLRLLNNYTCQFSLIKPTISVECQMKHTLGKI